MKKEKKKVKTALKTLQQKKKAFLTAFSECGNISQAAELAGIDRKNHYNWLKDDPDYPDQFYDADQKACDKLEQEARRRAIYGTSEPVFHKGEQCGVVQKYSDTLLIFLMKGANPEKYRENIRQEITGAGGGPIEVSFISGADEEAE